MKDYLNSDFFEMFSGAVRFVQEFANVLKEYHDWFDQHRETIIAYIQVFAEFGKWNLAMQKMADNQIMFTDDLPVELAAEINNAENIEPLVQSYFGDNNGTHMEELIARCRENRHIRRRSEFYAEIISAYSRSHYQLACTGLFSLIDGVLSDISQDDLTNFNKRIEKIETMISKKDSLSEIDRKMFGIYSCMDSVQKSMFGSVPFKERENDEVNRNRILHGRTHREYTAWDVLKVLLFLDAILIMGEQCRDETF